MEIDEKNNEKKNTEAPASIAPTEAVPSATPENHIDAELQDLLSDLPPISEDLLLTDEDAALEKNPSLKEMLGSDDVPSRFMTILSMVFAFLAITSIGLLIFAYLKYRHSNAPANVEERVKHTGPIAPHTQSLGEFKLYLKGELPRNEGELRVDIVAECSTKEACDSINEHMAQARDKINPILMGCSRDDMMKLESKNQIRTRMTEQLNTLPMNGKIIQVFFNDMTIERGD